LSWLVSRCRIAFVVFVLTILKKAETSVVSQEFLLLS
jgi:hypothetical protein